MEYGQGGLLEPVLSSTEYILLSDVASAFSEQFFHILHMIHIEYSPYFPYG